MLSASTPEAIPDRCATLVPLLPRLTVNGAFMDEFLSAPGPCGALGLVEARQRTRGFLAIRPDAILPATVTAAGFRFGHALLGTSHYTVVQFVFEFYGFARYHLLVRPDTTIVRTVLTRMADSGEFFILCRRWQRNGHHLQRRPRARLPR